MKNIAALLVFCCWSFPLFGTDAGAPADGYGDLQPLSSDAITRGSTPVDPAVPPLHSSRMEDELAGAAAATFMASVSGIIFLKIIWPRLKPTNWSWISPIFHHCKQPFFWSSLAVILLLTIAACGDVDAAFYGFLRVAVFGFCGYTAFASYKRGTFKLAWALAFTALLFNPFFRPEIERSVWILLDIAAAFAVVFSYTKLVSARSLP